MSQRTASTLVAGPLALLTACATPPPAGPADGGPAPREGPPALQATRSPFVEPPGVFWAEVKQSNIETTIFVSGWTATVRPSVSYTQGVKRRMLEESGVDPSEALKYELDHFVPLALGGHPSSIDNLWLQRWDGPWSARVKDRLERALQVAVCAGRPTLHAARETIRNNWKEAHRRYVGIPRDEPEEEEVVE